MVKDSLKTGIGFGLTSATITTLGLMVGLHSIETDSKIIVIGGILTIAVADAFSDALGIHISEESKNGAEPKHVWESTISTFLTKFFFALTFLVPVFLMPLGEAIIVSVLWGLLVLGVVSFRIAKEQGDKPSRVIFEHLFIALVVIAITQYLGDWIGGLR